MVTPNKMYNKFSIAGPKLFSAGYEPLPVKGKKPVISKDPALNKGWSTVEITAEKVVEMADNGLGNLSTGVRLGVVKATDVDVYDRDVAKALAVWMDDHLNGGKKLMRRYGEPPKFLVPCLVDDIDSKYASTKYVDADGNKNRIEVLAKGQQFVAYGIHEDTRKPYTWFNGDIIDVAPDDLPQFSKDDIDNLFNYFDELADKAGWDKNSGGHPGAMTSAAADFADLKTPSATFDELKEQVFKLPTGHCDDYDLWVKVGMIIHFETSGSDTGWRMFDTWSRLSDLYRGEKETRAKWESFSENRSPENTVTFGTLVEWNDSEELGADPEEINKINKINNGNKINPVNDLLIAQKGTISYMVRAYVLEHSGSFRLSQLYQYLGLIKPNHKASARVALTSLSAEGICENDQDVRGLWHRANIGLEAMDLTHELQPDADIWLPLDLNNYARVLQGQIVLLFGSTNAGKTALMFAMLNEVCKCSTYLKKSTPLAYARLLRVGGLEKPIRYLNSEMETFEIQDKLIKMGDHQHILDNCDFVKRSRDFHKAVDPHSVNFIDYISMEDEFYRIGGHLDRIANELESGLAVVGLQKKTGESFPRGGEFALERTRLAIDLDINETWGSTAKIRKLKIPVDGARDINGWERDFYIEGGFRIVTRNDWSIMTTKDRKKQNAIYKNLNDELEDLFK